MIRKRKGLKLYYAVTEESQAMIAAIYARQRTDQA